MASQLSIVGNFRLLQSHPQVGFILSFLCFPTVVIHNNEKLGLWDKVIENETIFKPEFHFYLHYNHTHILYMYTENLTLQSSYM